LDWHYGFGVLQMEAFQGTGKGIPPVRVGSTLYLDRLSAMGYTDTEESLAAFVQQAVLFLRRIYVERHGCEQTATILELLVQKMEENPVNKELCRTCIKAVAHSGKEAGQEQNVVLLGRLYAIAEKDEEYLYHLAASMESHIPDHFPVLKQLYQEYVLPANPQHILLAELVVYKLCNRIDYHDDEAPILLMAEGAA